MYLDVFTGGLCSVNQLHSFNLLWCHITIASYASHHQLCSKIHRTTSIAARRKADHKMQIIKLSETISAMLIFGVQCADCCTLLVALWSLWCVYTIWFVHRKWILLDINMCVKYAKNRKMHPHKWAKNDMTEFIIIEDQTTSGGESFKSTTLLKYAVKNIHKILTQVRTMQAATANNTTQ